MSTKYSFDQLISMSRWLRDEPWPADLGEAMMQCADMLASYAERTKEDAPTMLEALKAVVSVADRKTDEFDMARAAIASADGHAA